MFTLGFLSPLMTSFGIISQPLPFSPCDTDIIRQPQPHLHHQALSLLKLPQLDSPQCYPPNLPFASHWLLSLSQCGFCLYLLLCSVSFVYSWSSCAPWGTERTPPESPSLHSGPAPQRVDGLPINLRCVLFCAEWGVAGSSHAC